MRRTQSKLENGLVLDKIQNMTLKKTVPPAYYWIDQNIRNINNMRDKDFLCQFVKVRGFSSTSKAFEEISDNNSRQCIRVICSASLQEQEYYNMQENPYIRIIFLYCMNEEKAKLLMENFPKIKFAKFSIVDLKQQILQYQASEEKNAPLTSFLFFTPTNMNLLNKYRLIYRYLIMFPPTTQDKSAFEKLIRHIYPQKQRDLAYFKSNHNLQLHPNQKTKQTMRWVFNKNSFYWQAVEAFPKVTADPKKLGYLKLPFWQIYYSIKNNFHLQNKKIQEVYVVADLSHQEIQQFSKNRKNFVAPSTFLRGYLDQRAANQQHINRKRSFMIRVIFPKTEKKQQLQVGYYIEKNRNQGGNIIFNINNFFRVADFNADLREGVLQYGGYAQVLPIFQNRRRRPTEYENNLIRSQGYIEFQAKNQAKILQFCGHFEDSFQLLREQGEKLTKTKFSVQSLQQNMIQRGDASFINLKYQQAQSAYKSVYTDRLKDSSLLRLAELYLKTNNIKKLEETIEQVEKRLPSMKQHNPQQWLRARHILCIRKMRKQQFRGLQEQLNDILTGAYKLYKHKYQGIPLVHDVLRNLALCHMKNTEFDQALRLLKQVLKYQIQSQGIGSANAIFTQNMIKRVHESIDKDNQQVNEMEMSIIKSKRATNQSDLQFLKRRMIPPDEIDQSEINLITSQISQSSQQSFISSDLEDFQPLLEQSIN